MDTGKWLGRQEREVVRRHGAAHLVDAFIEQLDWVKERLSSGAASLTDTVVGANLLEINAAISDIDDVCGMVEHHKRQCLAWSQTMQAQDDMESLVVVLNRVAPAGMRFGMHPVDGAVWGWWNKTY